MRFLNADGSGAKMCGNGLRCVAAFCIDNGFSRDEIKVCTDDGQYAVKVLSKNPLSVRFRFKKPQTVGLPFLTEKKVWGKEFCGFKVWCIHIGADHAVVMTDKDSSDCVEQVLSLPVLKSRVNVDFVKVIDKKTVFCKTFERGVGWTAACGTGAAAAAYVCRKEGLTEQTAQIRFDGGNLLAKAGKNYVELTGGAQKEGVFYV